MIIISMIISVVTAEDIKTRYVARVIFAEAAGTTSVDRTLVASVINNRIKHPGFGKKKTAYDVVTQKGAFSCIKGNSLWDKPVEKFDQKELEIWQECLSLARFMPGMKKTTVVYYHDHRITKPKSWDNRWWTATEKIKTASFSFYSITQRERNE